MTLSTWFFSRQNFQQRLSTAYVLRVILLTFFISTPLISPQPADAEQDIIRIAITPCTDIIKTFTIFQPLARYLEGKLNRPVELIIPKDFYQFESVVKQNKVDFAYQAPHTYVRLAHLYNQDRLLKSLTPEGNIKHRGVIIVRKDSQIKTIEDLKGKVIMFGSELSTAKCLATKILLRDQGLDIDKDLKRYIHNGSCESIALSVFLKSVDAGAICDYSFLDIDNPEDLNENGIPAHQLEVIAETMEIPTWVFSALKETNEKVVTRVSQALLELSSDNETQEHILESAEIGGFVPAQDSDFGQMHRLDLKFQ